MASKMATKGKLTKITKDDQTSRRKRTKGHHTKSHDLGVKPYCKVFTFVLYTDVDRIETYDSTGGDILEEVEDTIRRLQQNPKNWVRFDPSTHGNRRSNKRPNTTGKSKGQMVSPFTEKPPSKRLRPAPVFDLKTLPMYSKRAKASPGLRQSMTDGNKDRFDHN